MKTKKQPQYQYQANAAEIAEANYKLAADSAFLLLYVKEDILRQTAPAQVMIHADGTQGITEAFNLAAEHMSAFPGENIRCKLITANENNKGTAQIQKFLQTQADQFKHSPLKATFKKKNLLIETSKANMSFKLDAEANVQAVAASLKGQKSTVFKERKENHTTSHDKNSDKKQKKEHFSKLKKLFHSPRSTS